MHILVVDDDFTSQQLLVGVLELEDHTADVCDFGEAALVLLRSQNYDALVAASLIFDMTGLELTRAALALRPSIRCVVVSTQERPEGAQHDPVTWIVKPFQLDELVAATSGELSRATCSQPS